MVIEDLVKLLVDNGLSVVCVGYLIYFQSTTMTRMLDALSQINLRLTTIETKLEEHNHENQQTAN